MACSPRRLGRKTGLCLLASTILHRAAQEPEVQQRPGLEKLAPINHVLPLKPCGLMLRVLLPLLPKGPDENVSSQGMGQVWP